MLTIIITAILYNLVRVYPTLLDHWELGRGDIVKFIKFGVLGFLGAVAVACGGTGKTDPNLETDRDVQIVFTQQALLDAGVTLEVMVRPQTADPDDTANCNDNQYCIEATPLFDPDDGTTQIGFVVNLDQDDGKQKAPLQGSTILISAVAKDAGGEVVYKTSDPPQSVTIEPPPAGTDAAHVVRLILIKVDETTTDLGMPSFQAVNHPLFASPDAVVAIDYSVTHTTPSKSRPEDLTVSWSLAPGVAGLETGTISVAHPVTSIVTPGRLWFSAPTDEHEVSITLTVTDVNGKTADFQFGLPVGVFPRDVVIEILAAEVNHGPVVDDITIAATWPLTLDSKVTITLDIRDPLDETAEKPAGDAITSIEWSVQSDRLHTIENGEGVAIFPQVCAGLFSDTAQLHVQDFTLLSPRRILEDTASVEEGGRVFLYPPEFLNAPELDGDGEVVTPGGKFILPIAGACVIQAIVTDERGAKGTAVFTFRPGTENNGLLPTVTHFNRDHQSSGAGALPAVDGTPNSPNAVSHDGQDNLAEVGDCGETGTTNATLSHMQEVVPETGVLVGSPFAAFGYSIVTNPTDGCTGDEFASAVFPLVLEGAQDIQGYKSLRFRVRSLTDTPVEVRITMREADTRECDGSITPRAASKMTYTAGVDWSSYAVALDLDRADGFDPSSAACGLDKSDVGSIGIEIVGGAGESGHLGIDDIVFDTTDP